MTLLTLYYLLALVCLVILGACLAGVEVASVSVNDYRLRARAEEGDAAAIRTVALLRDRRRILATTSVGTNGVHVLTALVAERLLAYTLAPEYHGRIPVIDFLIVTPILLLFAEIIPKHVFRVWSDTLIIRFSRFLAIASTVLVPIVTLCTAIVGVLTRPFGIKPGQNAPKTKMSPDDIRAILTEGVEQGEIARHERAMIDRIFDLQETMVREIMRPLVDVVVLRLPDVDIEKIKQVARDTGYSRFPAYRDKVINLEGYVDIYDILTKARPNDDPARFVRKGYVVPETARVDTLLADLLRQRQPAAIVIDEHGQSVGWVTLEDVLEEIVGEIEDEFDSREMPIIERLSDATIVVPAAMDLDDVNRQTGFELPVDDDFDTVGGLIYTRLGRVPEPGDTVTEGTLEFRVLRMQGHKISTVRIENLAPPPPPGSEADAIARREREELAAADDYLPPAQDLTPFSEHLPGDQDGRDSDSSIRRATPAAPPE